MKFYHKTNLDYDKPLSERTPGSLSSLPERTPAAYVRVYRAVVRTRPEVLYFHLQYDKSRAELNLRLRSSLPTAPVKIMIHMRYQPEILD